MSCMSILLLLNVYEVFLSHSQFGKESHTCRIDKNECGLTQTVDLAGEGDRFPNDHAEGLTPRDEFRCLRLLLMASHCNYQNQMHFIISGSNKWTNNDPSLCHLSLSYLGLLSQLLDRVMKVTHFTATTSPGSGNKATHKQHNFRFYFLSPKPHRTGQDIRSGPGLTSNLMGKESQKRDII